MPWYIRDVTVFGKDGSTRSLSLEPGVNIITGDNSTGKSAIIPIVDYCMGANEYQVPVGPIREYAAWFGILIQAVDEQIFVARKEPSPRNSTGKMHILVGREITIPPLSELTGNTERKAVIDELSRRLGIMDESLAESSYDTSQAAAPSIRSTAHFLFQPQNVVADKDVLFFKSVHPRHRSRLERVFPYLLGAVDSDYFDLRAELEAVQRKVNSLARQIERGRGLAASEVDTARALWTRAVDLELLEPGEAPESDRLRERLRELLQSLRPSPETRATVTGNPEWASSLEARSLELRSRLMIYGLGSRT